MALPKWATDSFCAATSRRVSSRQSDPMTSTDRNTCAAAITLKCVCTPSPSFERGFPVDGKPINSRESISASITAGVLNREFHIDRFVDPGDDHHVGLIMSHDELVLRPVEGFNDR
jgi:hypothetical protein